MFYNKYKEMKKQNEEVKASVTSTKASKGSKARKNYDNLELDNFVLGMQSDELTYFVFYMCCSDYDWMKELGKCIVSDNFRVKVRNLNKKEYLSFYYFKSEEHFEKTVNMVYQILVGDWKFQDKSCPVEEIDEYYNAVEDLLVRWTAQHDVSNYYIS